jgi:hypothetical protein
LKNVGLNDPKSSNDLIDGEDDIAMEVTAVRILLRKTNYLTEPFEIKKHVSLDGKTDLATELVGFTKTAKSN